jgi:hypothetical protein
MRLLLGLAIILTFAACKPEAGNTKRDTLVRSLTNKHIILNDGSKIALAADQDVIVCVRHAEKDTTQSNNPSLTRAGIDRSDRLTRILADFDLTGVFSTPFTRTLSTVTGAAAGHQLAVTPYRPAGIPKLAQSFKDDDTVQRAVIAGHSNTTPGLINQLMGKAHLLESIPEDQYDNFYVVILSDPPVIHELKY